MLPQIKWPDGKRFAFTIFDDTDAATLQDVAAVYSFLADCGMRTTKSAWPVRGDPKRGIGAGATCEDLDYLKCLLHLQSQGFEIAWHNATWHGLPRQNTIAAMNLFASHFGHDPVTAADHALGSDAMYAAEHQLTGTRALLYTALTRFRHWRKCRGHIEGDACFWGDECKQRIKYYRHFAYREANVLKVCPFMPFHDPRRPYVNYWFVASGGGLSEQDQDRLEEAGGACVMSAHLAPSSCEDGVLRPRFKALLTRLSRKSGWFVPVRTLLDFLLERNGHHDITGAERRGLERAWLREQISARIRHTWNRLRANSEGSKAS
jgi:hypothetical protein